MIIISVCVYFIVKGNEYSNFILIILSIAGISLGMNYQKGKEKRPIEYNPSQPNQENLPKEFRDVQGRFNKISKDVANTPIGEIKSQEDKMTEEENQTQQESSEESGESTKEESTEEEKEEQDNKTEEETSPTDEKTEDE